MSTPLLPETACRTHAQREAAGPCEDCGLLFCADCLVRIQGRLLCGPCKVWTVRQVRRRAGPRDRKAEEALVFSLIGLVPCLTPLAAPIGLVKGVGCLSAYRRDPSLPNRWKATLAVGIGGGALALWIFALGLWVTTQG